MTAVLHLTSPHQALLGIVAVEGDRATISIPMANVSLDEAEAMLEKALVVIRAARAATPMPASAP